MFINFIHVGSFLFYPRDEDVPAKLAEGIEVGLLGYIIHIIVFKVDTEITYVRR